MAYWLLKSEPSVWSWDQQVAAGARGTVWDGVRNHAAKNNMQAMRVGEQAFFYHSNQERAIVGLVEIIKPFQPNPDDPPFGAVEAKALQALKRPVTLAAVKADAALAKMALVVNSRLSVQPVRDEEWAHICALGGL